MNGNAGFTKSFEFDGDEDTGSAEEMTGGNETSGWRGGGV